MIAGGRCRGGSGSGGGGRVHAIVSVNIQSPELGRPFYILQGWWSRRGGRRQGEPRGLRWLGGSAVLVL